MSGTWFFINIEIMSNLCGWLHNDCGLPVLIGAHKSEGPRHWHSVSIDRTLENQIGPGQVVFFGFSWSSFGESIFQLPSPPQKKRWLRLCLSGVCQVFVRCIMAIFQHIFHRETKGKPRWFRGPLDLAASRGAAGAPLALNSPLPTDPTCHLGGQRPIAIWISSSEMACIKLQLAKDMGKIWGNVWGNCG